MLLLAGRNDRLRTPSYGRTRLRWATTRATCATSSSPSSRCFGAAKVLGTGPYAEVDEDTARSILDEVERLATDELAESLLDVRPHAAGVRPGHPHGDHAGGFKKSYQAYMDAEWWRLDLPEELGGTVVRPACAGPSPSWSSARTRPCTCTPPAWRFAHVVYRLGTEEQRKVAQRMVDGRWGATMVLTEPDAGSDVGAGRTKAIAAARRHLAHRGRQAVHHLGRARHGRQHRAPGAGPPRGRRRRAPRASRCSSSRSSTSTGTPASSASATASTSPTSSTRWGSRPRPPASSPSASSEPAVGWLVGEVHDGIAQMFKVIEFARMMVGTKAIATLSTGYLNALDYAKTRRAGPGPHPDDRQDARRG